MKSLSLLIFLCISVGFSTLSAQEPAQLQELILRLSENHMGAVTDVFSSSELELLKAHFYQLEETETVESLMLNRRGASTQNVTPVAVVSIDPENLNSIENLGPSSLEEFEGAGIVIVSDRRSVVVDNTNRVYFRELGTNTYIDTNVNIDVVPGESIVGIETLSNGDIFAIGTNGSTSSHLYQVDPENWSSMMIGNNNGLVLPISLARDASDNLITVDIDDDTAHRINPITGAPASLGPIGFDANFGQGMSYDADLGQILLTAFDAGAFDSQLRSMDPNTGATTLIGTITPGMLDQFGWNSWFDEDTLGSEDALFESFEFYPNPVADILNLRSEAIIDHISIVDISGKQLLSKEINALISEVDIADLSSGIYLLKVQIEGDSALFKFLKR